MYTEEFCSDCLQWWALPSSHWFSHYSPLRPQCELILLYKEVGCLRRRRSQSEEGKGGGGGGGGRRRRRTRRRTRRRRRRRRWRKKKNKNKKKKKEEESWWATWKRVAKTSVDFKTTAFLSSKSLYKCKWFVLRRPYAADGTVESKG